MDLSFQAELTRAWEWIGMMDGLWRSIPFYTVLKVLNVGGPRTYELKI